MDNIWIYLIVIAVMSIRALFKQSDKELDKHQQPDLSDVDMPELHFPQEQEEENPEVPVTQPQYTKQAEATKQPEYNRQAEASRQQAAIWQTINSLQTASAKQHATHSGTMKWRKNQTTLPEEGIRSINSPTAPALQTSTEEASEFSSPTPDELRKAVIWSEILQRKYV